MLGILILAPMGMHHLLKLNIANWEIPNISENGGVFMEKSSVLADFAM
jgi:hypothetical protein